MKNILMISHLSSGGGAEVIFKYVVDVLVKENYNVYVVLPKNQGWLYEEIKKNKKIKKFYILPFSILNINDSIFRIIRKKLFKNLLVAFKIKKIIKQERIDLIYGTTIVNIVPILTGLISNKNTIWHIHEQCNKYSDVYSKKIDFLMRYFFKKANIVYISETMKKIWKERIKLKDTLNEYVIYNPIKSEIEFFEKKESKSFGFAGTFYELKNISLFLEGINELQKEIPDIKIELCGHGMKRGVEKIIKEKN